MARPLLSRGPEVFTMHRFARRLIALLTIGVALVACGELTSREAQEALDEASLSSAALALTGSSIEIATHFTVGGAAETAAGEVRDFVASQLPCAQITARGATLTIAYGALPGTCTYRGQTYAGTHTLTVMATSATELQVHHEWTDFHNQTVSVTGSAMVTWSGTDATRHVSHTLTWTRLSDGHTGFSTGDETQARDAGLLTGFQESGERTWTSTSGTWTLDIDAVQMRWIDPCPEAGRYTLTTPAGKVIVLSFARTDATTIRATLSSGARTFDIDVFAL